MGHRIRFIAQIHNRVGNATGNIDERQVTELAIRSIKPGGQLCCQFEYEARTFAGNLTKSRVGHFCNFTFSACANPGASRRLLVKQPHFTEKLALVQVGQHHFIAILILDHDFDRAVDDVVQNVGKIAGMNHHRLGWDRAYPAITEESVYGWHVTQCLGCCLHFASLDGVQFFGEKLCSGVSIFNPAGAYQLCYIR